MSDVSPVQAGWGARLLALFRPKAVTYRALYVTLRDLIVWRRNAVAQVVGFIVDPLLYLVGLGFGLGLIVPKVEGYASYAAFIAPAIVVSSAMFAVSFESLFGAFTRMFSQKTYAAIFSAPVTPFEIVCGDVLYASLLGALCSFIVATVTAALGLVPWLAVLPLGLLGFIVGLCFASMAMIATAVSPGYEFFNFYITLLLTPMNIFSGVYFPLPTDPAWLASVAQISPLVHAIAVARALATGTLAWGDLGHVAVLLTLAVVFFVPAANLIERKLVE
jgi:lipooligosaccharide transport system permease protein